MNAYGQARSARKFRIRRPIPRVAGAVLLILGGWTVHADLFTRTTAHGNGADASVQGSGFFSNFGTSGVISSGNSTFSPANNYKDYFRFDLSGSGLDLANAVSATFQFSTANALAGVGFEFLGLPDGLPGDDASGWLETGITYFNAPGNPILPWTGTYLTTAPGDENGNYVVSLGTQTGINTTAGGIVSLSSPLLLDLIRNDSNGLVTIAMRRTDTQGTVQIASKETTSGFLMPTLVIEADPVPEPSPAMLAAAGFLVLLFRFSAQWKPRR